MLRVGVSVLVAGWRPREEKKKPSILLNSSTSRRQVATAGASWLHLRQLRPRHVCSFAVQLAESRPREREAQQPPAPRRLVRTNPFHKHSRV